MTSSTATAGTDAARTPRRTALLAKAGRGERLDATARAHRRAEDLLLVDGILRGDEDAFRAFVERYQRPLYWVAYDVLLDADEARDVVQEAFIRVHAALHRFDRKRDLMNWVFRIARNLAIDHFRRRRRRATPVEDVASLGEAAGFPPTSARPDAADEADLQAQVHRVLADLPVEYRLCLTLREFHGLAPRQIAQVTDCSYPTARWRLHRARKLFGEAWEARYGARPALEEGSA